MWIAVVLPFAGAAVGEMCLKRLPRGCGPVPCRRGRNRSCGSKARSSICLASSSLRPTQEIDQTDFLDSGSHVHGLGYAFVSSYQQVSDSIVAVFLVG